MIEKRTRQRPTSVCVLCGHYKRDARVLYCELTGKPVSKIHRTEPCVNRIGTAMGYGGDERRRKCSDGPYKPKEQSK